MDEFIVLLCKVILFGCLGGLAATLATVAIEKLGGAVGGILASSPSTIIPASIGVALTSSDEEFRKAMFSVPLGMWINVIFLYVWKYLPKIFPQLQAKWQLQLSSNKKLVTTLICSIIIWMIFGILVALISNALLSAGISIMWIGTTFFVIAVLFGLYVVIFQSQSAPAGKKPVTLLQWIMRPTLAATSIALSVFLSKWSGIVAGLASTFPSIFLTTMVAIWLAQGEKVTVGSVGPMCLGAGGVSLYAILFQFLFFHISFWAVPVTYLVVIIFYTSPVGYLTYRINQRLVADQPAESEDEEGALQELPVVELENEEVHHGDLR